METTIMQTIKHLWETWDIRVLVVLSLLIQFFLSFLAPLRKRCSNGIFLSIMWLLYLSADAVALFSIGLISSSQADAPVSGSGRNWELIVFWAPFLLLHLGGPDTITALSLEDNQLWHRHVLQLGTQVVVTLYVFIVSLRRHNSLWLATALIFVNGFIKYAERSVALYSACTEVIRDSLQEPMPPRYERMVEEHYSLSAADIPSMLEVKYGPTEGNTRNAHVDNSIDESAATPNGESNNDNGGDDPQLEWNSVDDDDDLIVYAYFYYNKSKGLLADAFLSLKDDGEIRDYFLYKRAEEAFRILEIELNLMYDVLHTKVFITYGKRGYFRVVAFVSVLGSLVIFCFKDKSNYDVLDVEITFSLLVGAIFLDVAALVMLVCSDWWIILVFNNSMPKLLRPVCSRMLKFVKWLKRIIRKGIIWKRIFNSKRWSQSICQYNLLQISLTPPKRWLSYIVVKQVKEIFIDCIYVTKTNFDDCTVKFIIEEIKKKANLATDGEAFKEVCLARGNLVLQDDKYFLVAEYLLPWTHDIDFDESLLIWHLATDICYWNASQHTRKKFYCKFSKELSDYMLYLLLRQQALLSKIVGNAEVRFAHTSDDIRLEKWNKEDIGSEHTSDNLEADNSSDTTNSETVSAVPIPSPTSDAMTPMRSPNNIDDNNPFEAYIASPSDDNYPIQIYIPSYLVDIYPIQASSPSNSDGDNPLQASGPSNSDGNNPLQASGPSNSDGNNPLQASAPSNSVHNNPLQASSPSKTDQNDTLEKLSEKFSKHVLERKDNEDLLALIAKAKDSQSVLKEARRLAMHLNKFGDEQWELTSKVWVEMLTYAAIHSTSRSHLAQLSKGAELITFVWLFLVHLGFREPLQPSRGLRATKLIIRK